MAQTECGVAQTECGVAQTECGVAQTECGVAQTECGVAQTECSVAQTECGVARLAVRRARFLIPTRHPREVSATELFSNYGMERTRESFGLFFLKHKLVIAYSKKFYRIRRIREKRINV